MEVYGQSLGSEESSKEYVMYLKKMQKVSRWGSQFFKLNFKYYLK
jgi:hypothetical protein